MVSKAQQIITQIQYPWLKRHLLFIRYQNKLPIFNPEYIRHEKRCDHGATGRGNCMLAALNFSYIHFFNLKYYGTFNYNTQIVYSNAHLNPLKGVFKDKPFIIAVILNFQFAEILCSRETWPRKVLNFSHV